MHPIKAFLMFAALLLLLPGGASGQTRTPAKVQDLRFWSNPTYTRVVIDVSREVDYRFATLPADPKAGIGNRLYVDILGAERAGSLKAAYPVEDGLLKQVRLGSPQGSTTRVVFDLTKLGDYKVFHLSDPFRIVVDLAGDGLPSLSSNHPEIRAMPPAPAPAPAKPAAKSAAPAPAKAPSGKEDGIGRILDRAPDDKPLSIHLPSGQERASLRRIVVDPGHGGKDPGAVGPNGLLEKDVNLAMAKLLKAHLEKELGVEVHLTRDRDVYLSLQERTAIANRLDADLFISLHANASPNRGAYGTETYFLNLARSEQAAAVAARENGTTLKEVGDLEAILFDLMANAKINESSRLASEIQKALVSDLSRSFTNIKDLGVRQGPFHVLIGATMPSVLVEVAFISHPREEALLADRQFQDKSARAIARAVRNYGVALNLLAQN
ncbi:N-acetylmuramoyl-L-alanine amidase [Geoalkalibacter sp.]|uniref:N-acetylmuramoyl-L-alanine amidase n=1 Tax=Geoalkalibacter sp. TaxID=3041440 RepID=UPI00272E8DBA|nr:N-acetylmuramoyl-L-alanine amidase [Geoalkalibacter sp.]